VADVLRNGQNLTPLKENDPIYLNDRIRTKSYSKIGIIFLDESEIKFAPNTCVEIREYALSGGNKRQIARVYLTRGKIEAVVSRTSKPDTFIIDTPNAVGTVKGSDIFVSYFANKTGIFVEKGLISVASQSVPADMVDIKKGDYVIVPFDELPGEIRSYLDAEMKRHKKDIAPALRKKFITYEEAKRLTAVISGMTGGVRIYKKGADDWRPAKLNEDIYEGDTLANVLQALTAGDLCEVGRCFPLAVQLGPLCGDLSMRATAPLPIVDVQ